MVAANFSQDAARLVAIIRENLCLISPVLLSILAPPNTGNLLSLSIPGEVN